MILSSDRNRIGIFAFFDKDGIVDEYIPTLIAGVGAFCKKMLIVVNGTLTAEGAARLAPLGTILYRANEGLDVCAYQHGYFHVLETGALQDCEELLFFNQTIFGPLYAMDALMEKVNAADCDFWGLTRHPEVENDFGDGEMITVPAHFQSYFFAARGTLLHSEAFEAYWRNLPPIQSYVDAVTLHEIRFTDHFEKQGWTGYTAIDAADIADCSVYPLMGLPLWMVRERGCPFCKRKSFIVPNGMLPNQVPKWGSLALYDFIRKETAYPIDLILENITRTAQPVDVFAALQYSHKAQMPSTPHVPTVVVIQISRDLPPLFESKLRVIRAAEKCIVIVPVGQEAYADALGFHRACDTIIATDEPAQVLLFTQLWEQVKTYERILFLMSNGLGKVRDTTFGESWNTLCDFETNEALFEQDSALGLLQLFPHTTGNVRRTSFEPHLDTVQQWLTPAFPRYHLTAFPCVDVPDIFYAKTACLAPLAALDWKTMPPALLEGEKPLLTLLPQIAVHATGKFACIMLSSFQDEQAIQLYDYMQRVNQIFADEHNERRDLVLFRMQGIYDYFEKYRYELRLDEFTQKNTPFKKKLWAILQILLSKSTTPDVAHRPEDA